MYCENCGNKIDNSHRFCTNCGKEVLGIGFAADKKWYRKGKIIAGLMVIILSLLIISLYYYGDEDYDSSRETGVVNNNQNQILSSVVNILCEDENGESGGSGTIILSDGVILTNAHIIPRDEAGDPTVDTCLVTLPDSQGKVKEIYFGEPSIIPYLSDSYDLAFINITEPYIDEEGENYGDYPKVFPAFLDMGCLNNNPQLGESVRVFGYPAISGGGYYLTVTDGLVSSLPNDGTIFVSAKINHGSSGGLAVDKDGCMLGIPSMISGDENESLGVLISNEIILDFIDELDSMQKLME